MISELKEKEKAVAKVERDIKDRHLEIQQKTLRVDHLNRKCAELGGRGDGDESSGPLEIQIENLKKQIKEVEEQTTQVQKEWI